jgi:hypothetical protein
MVRIRGMIPNWFNFARAVEHQYHIYIYIMDKSVFLLSKIGKQFSTTLCKINNQRVT